ncbi:PTS sugar transporter subunit IIA [Lysobacter sp. cf310]|uniref:PTS sugar transporter subunit IIA n=1 Tax=Lysobacter sp. cf310 TaxID=1761790 RepID=UPI0008F37E81|nr:PTS sugar transporter subunit IIA [Lysobacter sp. cf310]SFK36836.1 PTS system, nitrogen regulatory IIA component [Lysobacter sp. cf310]
MPLHELLSAQRVAILEESGDRDTVLDAAARLLADGTPTAIRAIGDSLRERERLASTAIGHGVAIPHGRSALFDDSRGAFLRLEQPVDFGAADGEKVDLVLAMTVPEHYVQQHLQLLAELAERFGDADFRAALRGAADVDELGWRLLGGTALRSGARA